MKVGRDGNYEAYKEACRQLYHAVKADPYDHDAWLKAQSDIRVAFDKVKIHDGT